MDNADPVPQTTSPEPSAADASQPNQSPDFLSSADEGEPSLTSQFALVDDVFDLLSQEQSIMAALPPVRSRPGRRRFFSRSSLPYDGGLAVDKQSREEEESEFEEFEKVARKSPPYLVSIILHMSVLIFLGLWMLYEPPEKTISLEASFSQVEEDRLEDEPFELGTDEELLEEEIDPQSDLLSMERQEVFTSSDSVPEIDLLHTPLQDNPTALPDSPNTKFVPPQVGRLLKGRKPELRPVLLRKYGGNAQTEEAVKNSLDWLVRNQREDGSWSLKGPYADGGQSENDLAATGLALLALQGAGHTHNAETKTPYSIAVAKGWKWLLSQQVAADRLANELSWQGYSHAICTIAICELYAMTSDEKFRKPAQQAVNYCLEAQGPNGGWRYSKGEPGDTSVTGWYVMALQSAKMAKLEVPDETLAKVNGFLDAVQSDGGRRYGYSDPHSQPLSLTAEGLLCRQYLGWKHDDNRLVDGVEFLGKNVIRWEDRNTYYWYYATQVLHHMEGESWDRWNAVMRDVLPAKQIKDGPEAGSWDPIGDRWGPQGGRLYVTCLHTFMLEVYYRHLPLYNYSIGR